MLTFHIPFALWVLTLTKNLLKTKQGKLHLGMTIERTNNIIRAEEWRHQAIREINKQPLESNFPDTMKHVIWFNAQILSLRPNVISHNGTYVFIIIITKSYSENNESLVFPWEPFIISRFLDKMLFYIILDFCLLCLFLSSSLRGISRYCKIPILMGYIHLINYVSHIQIINYF